MGNGLYRPFWPGNHLDSRIEVHHTVLRDVTPTASDNAVEHAEANKRSGSVLHRMTGVTSEKGA